MKSFGEGLNFNSKEPTKYVSLNNQSYQAKQTLANINSGQTFIHLLLVLISLMEFATPSMTQKP